MLDSTEGAIHELTRACLPSAVGCIYSEDRQPPSGSVVTLKLQDSDSIDGCHIVGREIRLTFATAAAFPKLAEMHLLCASCVLFGCDSVSNVLPGLKPEAYTAIKRAWENRFLLLPFKLRNKGSGVCVAGIPAISARTEHPSHTKTALRLKDIIVNRVFFNKQLVPFIRPGVNAREVTTSRWIKNLLVMADKAKREVAYYA